MAFVHNREAIHTLTVGPPGVGKTQYRGIRFLFEEWLPKHEGDYIHNLPLDSDAIAKECGGEAKAEDYARRIKRIPPKVHQAWKEGRSGPWHYFCGFEPTSYKEDAEYVDASGNTWEWYQENGERDEEEQGIVIYPHAMNLAGARIVFDELQDYCGPDKPKEHRAKWRGFLALLRHYGATSEGMTQGEKQIASEYLGLVTCKYEFHSRTQLRFPPYVGIVLADFYELAGAYLRGYWRRVHVREYSQINKKWECVATDKFFVCPRYNHLYNSHAAGSGGGKGGKEEPHEWEKRSFLGVHWWFFRKNLHAWIIATVIYFAAMWLTVGGGTEKLIAGTFHWMQDAIREAGIGKTRRKAHSQASSVVGTAQAAAIESPAVRKQLNEVAEAVRVVESENQAWRDRFNEEWAIVYLSKEAIGFKNGDTIRLGEEIPDGVLKGEVPTAIDWWRRVVLMRSGRTVRMRFDPDRVRPLVGADAPTASGGTSPGSFRGSLPPAPSADQATSPSRAGRMAPSRSSATK
ncbi:MAG: hypothetical protein K8T91_12965 [Planctomycetes bacterium]|nr:hypothetical protein [Planctomycetota bacterium]